MDQQMCRVCVYPEQTNLINLYSFSSISVLAYLKTVVIMEVSKFIKTRSFRLILI